jgi:hypothetical protein
VSAAEIKDVVTNQACMHCGSLPAVEVTLRRQIGRGVRRRLRSVAGPMCRQCGLALFRRMTDRSLTSGWWGVPAVFSNWAVLAGNLSASRRLLPLAAPARPAGAQAPRTQPLQPGPPLLARPGVWLAVFLLAVAGVVTSGVAGAVRRDGDTRLAGRCIVFTADGTRLGDVVPCSRGHDAEVVDVSTEADACPASTDGYFEHRHGGEVLCVRGVTP